MRIQNGIIPDASAEVLGATAPTGRLKSCESMNPRAYMCLLRALQSLSHEPTPSLSCLLSLSLSFFLPSTGVKSASGPGRRPPRSPLFGGTERWLGSSVTGCPRCAAGGSPLIEEVSPVRRAFLRALLDFFLCLKVSPLDTTAMGWPASRLPPLAALLVASLSLCHVQVLVAVLQSGGVSST